MADSENFTDPEIGEKIDLWVRRSWIEQGYLPRDFGQRLESRDNAQHHIGACLGNGSYPVYVPKTGII